MTDHLDLLQCPLCEGQGHVRRYHLVQFFSDPELQAKIAGYLGKDAPDAPDTAPVLAGTPAKTRDFQKEVHSWNPQVPMWQRSPKE
jgi:hypothetical protein